MEWFLLKQLLVAIEMVYSHVIGVISTLYPKILTISDSLILVEYFWLTFFDVNIKL